MGRKATLFDSFSIQTYISIQCVDIYDLYILSLYLFLKIRMTKLLNFYEKLFGLLLTRKMPISKTLFDSTLIFLFKTKPTFTSNCFKTLLIFFVWYFTFSLHIFYVNIPRL